MKKICFSMVFALMAASFAAMVKDGDSIAFMGDSITEHGWKLRDGYLRLCAAAFSANGLQVRIIPAGVSGNKSDRMLARLDKDVLSQKPTFMTLSCGVNDVWHKQGISLEQYKENLTAILDRCRDSGVKVIVLTATMIGEDENNERNVKLRPYNEWLREVAKERGLPLADTGAVMRAMVAAHRGEGYDDKLLTWDGVHMNSKGNEMMASVILRTLGFSKEEMFKARRAWSTLRSNTLPSRFVIDLDGRDDKIVMKDVTTDDKFQAPVFPTWVGPENLNCYLQVRGKHDLTEKWESFQFSFVPQKSGRIKLRLRGVETPKNTIRWCAYDKLEAEGAAIRNGSFEKRNGRNVEHWRLDLRSPKVNRSDAADGTTYVECAQYIFGDQIITVTAGTPVTIRFMARSGAVEVK